MRLSGRTGRRYLWRWREPLTVVWPMGNGLFMLFRTASFLLSARWYTARAAEDYVKEKEKHCWLTVPLVTVGHVPRIQNPRIKRLYAGVRILSSE